MSNLTLAIRSTKEIAKTIETLYKTTVLRIVIYQKEEGPSLFECFIFIPINNFGQIYDKDCRITNIHYDNLISFFKLNAGWEFDYLGDIRMSYICDEERITNNSYVSADILLKGNLYEEYGSFKYAKLRFFLK